METLVKISSKEPRINTQSTMLTLTNREKLNLTGVSKVVSANDTTIACVLGSDNLCINGVELLVNKFDVDGQSLEIVGVIDSIKFTVSKNLLKKFFK